MVHFEARKSPLAVAIAVALGSTSVGIAPTAVANDKTPGKYVAGDIHNHTTCSDGSISMQKLVSKSTSQTPDVPWGLDWFVQAGHGGSGNRNCTLAEDESLATPAYPLVTSTTGELQGPTTTWQNTNPPVTIKGDVSGTPPEQNMWRWQSVQEFQYPLLEYLAARQDKPMFMGIESVVAGHEHTSMSVITGQMPRAVEGSTPPDSAPYYPLGNANALAQWAYCFDRGNADTSRGAGQAWDCSVPGSPNAQAPDWNELAAKLVPAPGPGTGERGHEKTVEAVKWMAAFHGKRSYYIPTHLERAGPFVPDGNNGFNVEHLRNFNNAAPAVAFGMETQPGHGASADRGEYAPRRNTVGTTRLDSVGGTTYGGTGVYGAQIGGVWDAMLGEGRNFWFIASSDWHNRGAFGADDRRTTQDFYPGEYQRNYTFVRGEKLRPQSIVDGLRTGNTFVSSGQLIDRLAFVACEARPRRGRQADAVADALAEDASVEARALHAAMNATEIDHRRCATMGEKLEVSPGSDIIVSIVVRDPSGSSYSPYTFPNPSLKQIGVVQPLDKPVLDHIDVIGGLVSGYRQPGAEDYAGAWPNSWLDNPDMSTVPEAAKNPTAMIQKTFNSSTWTEAGGDFRKMTYRIPAVSDSQYLRLRGTNLPASVPFETDANGNPLRDLETNAGAVNASSVNGADGTPENFYLKIPCDTTGTTDFDGCPAHLPTKTEGSYTGKFSAYDVAAWADLWFYSNPIYVEVRDSTVVAGVK